MDKINSGFKPYRTYWAAILVFLIFQYSNLYMPKFGLLNSPSQKFLWSISAELIEAVIVILLLRIELKTDWQQLTRRKLLFGGTVLIGFISMILWDGVYNNLFSMIQNANDHVVSNLYLLHPVIALFFGSILVPIVEELVFRKSLLRILTNLCHSTIVAIILSSFLFGIAHWNFTQASLFSQAELQGIILRTGIGMILAVVYLKSKSIYSTMILHAIYNLLL